MILALGAALGAATPAVGGGFSSPSRNIGCYVNAQSARCDIVKRDWPRPPRPASCTSQFAWGQGIVVGRSGRGHFICAGDTTIGSGRVLPYGSSTSIGRFTCTSRTAGIRCVNRRNGHGFFISRQRYQLY